MSFGKIMQVAVAGRYKKRKYKSGKYQGATGYYSRYPRMNERQWTAAKILRGFLVLLLIVLTFKFVKPLNNWLNGQLAKLKQRKRDKYNFIQANGAMGNHWDNSAIIYDTIHNVDFSGVINDQKIAMILKTTPPEEHKNLEKAYADQFHVLMSAEINEHAPAVKALPEVVNLLTEGSWLQQALNKSIGG